MKALTLMRPIAFAFVLAIVLAIPGVVRDPPVLPLALDADPTAVILALAPAAGPAPAVPGPAPFAFLAAPLARWLDPGAGVGFAAGAALMGAFAALLARRRRDQRPPVEALPDVIAEVVAPAPAPPAPPAPARGELNALSNALATIDMLDVEARTSLRHAGRAVAELAELIGQGRLIASEPKLIADQAVAAVAAQRSAVAATRDRARARVDEAAGLRAHGAAVGQRARAALDAAEAMDAAFQAFLALVEGRALQPDGDARTKAERLNEALAALTGAIVAIEERLVELDETVGAAPPPVLDTADGAEETFDRATERLGGALDALAGALGPVDRYTAEVRTRADGVTRTLDQALDRVATILAGFAGREDRRRFHRVHADLGAKLLVDDTWTDCRIINISLGGAAVDVALDCAPGKGGQLSLHGWDGLMPVIVTGTSQGRTHLCFQVTEALERSIKGFIDHLPAAA